MTLRWTAGPHRRLPKQMMTLTRTKKKTHIQGRGVGKFACFFLLMVICTGLTAVQPAEAAFPVVQAINTSSEPINTANHTVNLPSSISSGDLLIVFFSCDANETVTWPGGWTSIFHQTNSNTLDIGYKIADGAEGAAVTVLTGTNEKSAHLSYRITGHDSAQAPQASTGATSTSTSPNPDSLTPTGGAKDYLWIAVEGNDDGRDSPSVYPSSYTNGQTSAQGSRGGANVAVARRELNAASEDPGAFTIPSEEWVACTVAVHPILIPDLSWTTGSADFKIYQSSNLTWDSGTLVCSGSLSDTNGDTIDCNSGTIANSTQYRVQLVLDNTGTADATMASGDYVDHVAVKGGWAGTSPTLGNCAFNDLDSDNTSTTCSAAWNATNNVRITNTGTEVKIAYAGTNNAEGFMYLITTDNDVPAAHTGSYMNASIDTITEDSSKISISGPSNPAPTWATGSADFKIYQSSNLTWDSGTLVCSGTLNDNNASTIDCDSGTLANSTQYRVQVVLENIGTADTEMSGSGEYVDHVAVKGGWAGTSPTLGNCAFNDLDSDNGSTTCSAAWNATNNVRITNTGGGTVKIAYAATNNAEGFMYLITTDSDVPVGDSGSYMNTSIDSVTQDSSKININGPLSDLSWSIGSPEFMIYESSSLTWDAGTLVCGGILTDTNGDTIDCKPFTIADSTQYRVQVVLENNGVNDARMAASDYMDHVAVKGGWAGTSPTLGNCAFYDLDSDNTSATCSASMNGNDVRITNTGTEVKIAYADTNNAEGFMYLITTDSDVPTSDTTGYMNASIDTVTEDSSKIRFSGPSPTVQDTANSAQTSNTDTHTVSLPSNISAGDLLIVFFAVDANPTITWPTADGWGVIFSQANGNVNKLEIGYKIADGTEGASITITTDSTQNSAHIANRITGHDLYGAPEVSSGATGNSTAPNPDSLTPTGGAKDYLWFAVEGNDDGRDPASAYPGSYTGGQTMASGGSGGTNVAVARRELNAVSEDPGTFTIPSETWVACTVAVHPSTAPTAVDLLSFSAKGDGAAVNVEWQTASETDNLGFHLYRATSPSSPYERLTDKLISATVTPGKGGTYSYLDTDVAVGTLYYYKLEDIDAYGKHTEHGPISVDWDADGMPDDWEITHGLNPWINDADLDYDGDGLSNLEEYEYDLDPFNADTDGDGIPDGQEDGRLPAREDRGSRSIGPGVEVLAADSSGMTLVLNTSGFEAEVVNANSQEYEQLAVADYVHGYTGQVGAPQLPLKGLLIDVPAGKAAELTVINSQVEPYSGYRIYPVPETVLDAAGGMAAVGSAFYQDDLAYSSDGIYPAAIAALGDSYIFRDQHKQQVIFYPIGFNPASGQLLLNRRIELRIDFVDGLYAQEIPTEQMPWQVPDGNPGVLSPIALGLAAAPALVNPASPLLSALGAAITAWWSPPDVADRDVYKIITDTEGIYRISKDWLESYGVDTTTISLSALRLYHLGAEVAIEVYDQNSDDQMDAADTIHFYAAPISPVYTKYSDQNVYWLTLSGGSGAPLRMATIDGDRRRGRLADDFADTVHHEKNQVIWLRAPGEDDIERWFFNTYVQGTEHSGGGQPKSFTINVPDPTSNGTLTILMAGQTNTNHVVAVAINGVEQSFSWSGISYYEAIVEDVPLMDGDNTVTLQCLSADGNDSIIVDWFKVNYWRNYVAQGDTLTFSPESGSRYRIDGFSSDTVLVYDISDPVDVAKIENAQISGSNPYSVEFRPDKGGDTYLALTADTAQIPVELIQDRASNLADNANSADYILITHGEVGWDANGDQLAWLTDLIAHREDQGLRVFVADIEDIYDEFSFGIQSPRAVKDFLAYAYSNWTAPAAQHVVLVGDATYDPKDNWNMGDATAYLPTHMIYTGLKGETVTDHWFVTFSGKDAMADMHIGRLPAANEAQAAVMVAKIIAYENATTPESWQNNMLLVADNQREGSEYAYEVAFETINEDAAALIPEAMADPFRFYLNDYTATAYLTDDIIDAINDGVLMVNYAGHGATQILAEEHIFDAGDVSALNNSDRLPFFVSMACETGFFAYPENWFYPSLAEALLRSQNGAVAAFMSTGMTAVEGQQILDAALFEAIFTKDIRHIGPVIAHAKQTLLANGESGFTEISDTFLLFGDPATKLKIPLPHMPAGVNATTKPKGVAISWQPSSDSNQEPVAGYNVYRADSASGPYSKINIGLVTDSAYVDTGSSIAAASGNVVSGSSYYKVSAVTDSGFESIQSLAVKPASAGGSSSGGGGGGCFISSATSTVTVKVSWMVLIVIGAVVIFGVRFQEKKKD